MEINNIESIGIVTLIVGLGLGIDELLRNHQKRKLQIVLTDWWVYVEELRIKDLVSKILIPVITYESKFFGKKNSSKFFMRFIVFSIIITLLFMLIGIYIDFLDNYPLEDRTINSFWEENIKYFIIKDAAIIFPINILFDFVSLSITLSIFRLILKISNNLVRLSLICFDLMICYLLAAYSFACYWLLRFEKEESETLLDFISFGISREFNGFYYYKNLLNFISGDEVHDLHVTLFFASTIFIPTLIYLSVVFISIISIIIFRSLKYITTHFLALSIETEKSIFFYTATLIAVIVLLFRLILSIY